MNPLEEYPKARRRVYQAFWAASLVVGTAQVGFLTSETPTPAWLDVALGVLPFVGAGIGYTASSNVNKDKANGYASGV